MNPRLPGLVALVDAMLAAPDATKAVDRLCSEEDATTKFTAGAYVFRMAGVGGSSTMDRHHALVSWLRCARRKLEKEAA
jgi:hypothetical protein